MLTHLALTLTTTTTVASGLCAYRLRGRLRTDPLTGLGNRLALVEAFERARRRTPMVAVALGDMNGFKALNDTHGHRFGDRVLVEVATRLRRCAVGGELPVRLHGDEFAVLIPCSTTDRACRRADDYRAAVDSLDVVDGQPIAASMAFGVMAAPSGTAELSALLATADDRMYGDKHITHPTPEAPCAGLFHPLEGMTSHAHPHDRQGLPGRPADPARGARAAGRGLADQPGVVHRGRPVPDRPRQGPVRPAQAE
ncbi:GGDEF domain-containing protein [Saccharomonospora halophila]|uniref:GGDEF domain-containing protein n=1 Tax=Saccharomonospora halophila TaxID=129922 RepID=UPI0003AA52EB|nr:GGDEF domain-containing protein [Saccharomonospora halophila]